MEQLNNTTNELSLELINEMADDKVFDNLKGAVALLDALEVSEVNGPHIYQEYAFKILRNVINNSIKNIDILLSECKK